MSKVEMFLRHPWRIINSLNSRGIATFIPDEWVLRMQYKDLTGMKLNLKEPRTFNEKLQWLKLHDHNPLYTTMVDKYEAKKYVAGIIGEEYIIPTLGVWDRFDDIDFESLPDQFVLKCTHNSGGIAIVRDKNEFEYDKERAKFEYCLRNNYFWGGREWPYKDVMPRIIAEMYMEDESGFELKDYKVFNFNGVSKIIQVDYDRFTNHMRNLYDTDWNFIEAQIQFPNNPDRVIKKPQKLEEMITLAQKLSMGIPHVRTDFYSINDKLYFGEITFYHGSGFEKFTPQQFGIELGSWLNIPGGGILIKREGYDILLRAFAGYSPHELTDYKFYCFNGDPKFLYISKANMDENGAKHDTMSFKYCNWEDAPFYRTDHKPYQYILERPQMLSEMCEVAKALTKGIPFVRLDLYCINSKIFFSEYTFYPGGGYGLFSPDEWNYTFGKWINISS